MLCDFNSYRLEEEQGPQVRCDLAVCNCGFQATAAEVKPSQPVFLKKKKKKVKKIFDQHLDSGNCDYMPVYCSIN